MILVDQDGSWQPASLTNWDNEKHLQNMLLNFPDLIPGCAGAAVVDELTIPGIGLVDLVCVDDAGTITLVECKLAKNAEIRRAVVGQIFAYASGLQGIDYENFASAFANRGATSLVDAVRVGAVGDFDEIEFRGRVGAALAQGSFRLVVAVDAITAELKAIIEYLNVHLTGVTILALELGRLKQGNLEALVPAYYGAEVPEPAAHTTSQPVRPRWTEESVREAAQELLSGAERELVNTLLSHAEGAKAVVKGGTGAARSAGFYYKVAGQTRSVWSLYVRPEGAKVAVNLGSIYAASPARAKRVLTILRGSTVLAEPLPPTDEDAIGRYPEYEVATVVHAGAGQALVEAIAEGASPTREGTERIADAPA